MMKEFLDNNKDIIEIMNNHHKEFAKLYEGKMFDFKLSDDDSIVYINDGNKKCEHFLFVKQTNRIYFYNNENDLLYVVFIHGNGNFLNFINNYIRKNKIKKILK